MKCFEVVDHRIVPGFPVTTGSQINSQTYVSLAAGGEQDGLKVFLTRELIDLMQEDRSNRVYNAELVRQGDGSYWLKPAARKTSSALVMFNEGMDRRPCANNSLIAGLFHHCDATVEETVCSSSISENRHYLGFIAVLKAEGEIKVGVEEQRPVPGTGRTILRPFRRLHRVRYDNLVYAIQNDGANVSLRENDDIEWFLWRRRK